jgi:hypothetical protein
LQLKSSLGVDRLGRQHQLQRDAGTADVDETGDAAVAVVEAAAGLEGAEPGAVGGDAEVAGEGELEAARQRPAVDCADHRLVEVRHAAGQATEAEVDDLAHPGRGRVDVVDRHVGLEVGPGAEGVAGPAEDRDVDAVVVAKVLPGLTQRGVHLRVDRVLRPRPIQGDEGDPVPLLVEHHIRHRVPPVDCGTSLRREEIGCTP